MLLDWLPCPDELELEERWPCIGGRFWPGAMMVARAPVLKTGAYGRLCCVGEQPNEQAGSDRRKTGCALN